jgi:lipoprotein-releasing system permease protein
MFGPFERLVAGRYLRARRGERFVSVIGLFSLVGIALGVATLIIVMSVMGGFRADLLNRILGFNGDLGVYAAGAPMTNYQSVAATIRGLPQVISAVPVVDGQALLNAPGGAATGGYVRGITPEDLRRFASVASHIRQGTLADFKGDDAVAVGSTLAARDGLAIGDRLTLVSPQGAATAFGTIPRVRAYKVVAIFSVGMSEYDSSYVFLPLAAAQVFFQQKDAASQIEVSVVNPDRVQSVTAEISRALAGQPLRIVDWQQSNNSFFDAIKVEENVMFLILTLIIVVAAFNVISSMIMMVKDKTGDIAVLRTIGAGRGAIMRIFLMAGASIGVVGTAVGTLLGVVFCLNIERIQHWVEAVTQTQVFNPEVYYLSHLPARLNWSQVGEIIAMALALSFLATLYPSWRAARTDPVEALRHE